MKRLAIPLIRQRNSYLCGIACARMVAKYFSYVLSEKNAIDYAGVRIASLRRTGLPNKAIAKIFRKVGLRANATSNCTIQELRSACREHPVVITYVDQRRTYGHMAIVLAVTSKFVFLRDPAHKNDLRIPLSNFKLRWLSGYEKFPRWMCVVSAGNKKE